MHRRCRIRPACRRVFARARPNRGLRTRLDIASIFQWELESGRVETSFAGRRRLNIGPASFCQSETEIPFEIRHSAENAELGNANGRSAGGHETVTAPRWIPTWWRFSLIMK